jgi:NAD(P)-dependent dehydrogenase (short-subunit alcohol dehydrogenase family)
VRREDEIRRLVERTLKRFGRLDAAVNNAGTEGKPGPVVEQTADTYAATFDTNVQSLCQACAYRIRARPPRLMRSCSAPRSTR